MRQQMEEEQWDLCRLLDAALHGRPAEMLPPAEKYGAILELADRHRVLPLLYDVLAPKLPEEDENRKRLEKRSAETVRQSYRLLFLGKYVTGLLQEHGIEVVVGMLEEECKDLIRVFRKYITTGRPYVLMKYAMTMDGKIATYTGASKWITGEKARACVQETRNEFSGIMVGVNTVLKDDPSLTCRMENGRNPIRIICDTHLRTPLHAQVVQTAKEVPTWIATAVTDTTKKAQYENLGCRILEVPQKDGHIDLQVLMRLLGEENVDGILLEGGGTLNWSALRAEIVDAVQTYIAPKIFGGTAQSPVEGAGVALPDEGIRLENTRCISCGEDYRIESDVVYTCLQES